MCGIVGVIELKEKVNKSIIQEMLAPIHHRGPDNEGIYVDNNIGFGFKRLSIIDLSTNASQPMVSKDGNYTIVFNGEIYNHETIRYNLIKLGYSFNSNSDSEVLLYAFIEYGKNCLQKLNGMFAFSIYDKVNQKIFLARDRAGKKPLHYYYDGRVLLFASEIKSLLANKIVSRDISNKGLFQYLTLGYTIAPDSIFTGITKLKPGHFLEFYTQDLNEEPTQQEYWRISFCEENNKYENIYEWGEEFYSLFKDSTSLRLNSDVPLAVFLSGGLDSSAITAAVAANSNEEINAFTIGFDDAKFSEVNTAKALVEKYPNINHHILNLKVEQMLDDFNIIDSLDEPFSDSSIIPTFWVSKLVKEAGYTVALSGDGGDELLAGYYKNKPFELYDNWFRFTNRPFRMGVNSISKKIISRESKYFSLIERAALDEHELYWFTRSLKFFMFQDIFRYDFIENNLSYNFIFPGIKDHREKTMKIFDTYDFKYRLADGFLTKVDRASMFTSLEVRNPLLDYRIIELLSKIPTKYKFSNNTTKILLRHVLKTKDLVPSQVLDQKKMGFSIPLRDWVHINMKNTIKETIISSSVRLIIKENALDFLFNEGIKLGMHNHFTELLWRLFILARYLNNWDLKIK
jgi:asparagine synthase (glutamine-hydrolysing)